MGVEPIKDSFAGCRLTDWLDVQKTVRGNNNRTRRVAMTKASRAVER